MGVKCLMSNSGPRSIAMMSEDDENRDFQEKSQVRPIASEAEKPPC